MTTAVKSAGDTLVDPSAHDYGTAIELKALHQEQRRLGLAFPAGSIMQFPSNAEMSSDWVRVLGKRSEVPISKYPSLHRRFKSQFGAPTERGKFWLPGLADISDHCGAVSRHFGYAVGGTSSSTDNIFAGTLFQNPARSIVITNMSWFRWNTITSAGSSIDVSATIDDGSSARTILSTSITTTVTQRARQDLTRSFDAAYLDEAYGAPVMLPDENLRFFTQSSNYTGGQLVVSMSYLVINPLFDYWLKVT